MYKVILPIHYFFRRRITFLAVAAVALCVFIVVVVMTVHGGLVVGFKEKNHNFVGDCVVSTDSLVGFAYYEDFFAELEKQDFIQAASVVVKGFSLLTQPGRDRSIGVEIMGIEPGNHSRTTGFGNTLYYHRDNPENVFTPSYSPQKPGCVVGIILMLGGTDRSGQYYHSKNPSQLELEISSFPLTAKGGLASLGTDLVNTKTFYYSDDSRTGIPRVDGQTIYLPLDHAQTLCGMAGPTKRASAIHIKFTEGISLSAGCEKVKRMWNRFVTAHKNEKHANLLENVLVQSWIDYRRGIIAPMEKQQTMLIILFAMLGIITVFIIFVVFYMIISHKSKDIGILKSIGVSFGSVIEIFLGFAMIVGIIGGGIGAAAGCAFLVNVNDMENWLFEHFQWQLFDRSVYAIGDLPNEIEPGILAVIFAAAIAASVAGALLPTMQAARRRPTEILQVDQL